MKLGGIKILLEQKQCDCEIFHFFQESYESLNVTLCDTMTKLEQKQFDSKILIYFHKLNVPLCATRIMLEQQFDYKCFHFPHKLY
jgi:hypothetical protein